MPTVYQGIQGTNTNLIANLPNGARLYQMDQRIRDYAINKAYLTKLLTGGSAAGTGPKGNTSKGLKKKEFRGHQFYWFTDEMMSDSALLHGTTVCGGSWDGVDTAASGTLALATAGDYTKFAVNDVILIADATHYTRPLRVTAVASGTITAQTVDGENIDFTTDPVGERIFIIGNATDTAEGLQTERHQQIVSHYNYVQIFQKPISLTHSEADSEYITGDERAFRRNKAMLEHYFEIEKALFFGQRALDSAGAYPRYFMGGLLNFISGGDNDYGDADKALTFDEFVEWIHGCVREATSPVVFCSETILGSLWKWASKIGQVSITDTQNFLGMSVNQVVLPYGHNIKFIPHNEIFKNFTAGYGPAAFCVDLDDLEYVMFKGKDTQLFEDLQQTDLKVYQDEWRTYCSLLVGDARRHGVLRNVSSISVS